MIWRTLLAAALIAAPWTASVANAAETFQVDAVHSAVIYRIKHLNVSYSIGRLNNIAGSFTLDPDPSKCQFDFTIKVDSLDTGNTARDGHLKGPDFFNARQFPTITFKSQSVASAGKDVYEVKGNLTLHGVSKPVTLKIEQTGMGPGMRGGKLAGLLTEFSIKRSDYGMTNMLNAVGDDVKITVSVEGGHQ